MYDQRGAPLVRVVNGDGMGGARIDIGAYERQTIPPALFGDYNRNGRVDGADYVVWRKTLNQTVAAYGGADGDGDGRVDQDDFGVWRAHFGQTVVAAGAGAGSLLAAPDSEAARQSAMAAEGAVNLPGPASASSWTQRRQIGFGQPPPVSLRDASGFDTRRLQLVLAWQVPRRPDLREAPLLETRDDVGGDAADLKGGKHLEALHRVFDVWQWRDFI
jgi:hypothetical protein